MTNLDRRSLLRLGATAAAASLTPWLHSEASPAASNIKLTLNTTAAIPIPADFTGLSYETAQLAHPGFFSARNTALVALVKTLGPNGVLRIGGNTSEFAVWTVDGEDTEASENLTPVDPDRPGLPGPHIDKPYNVYPRAIDELKTFLDATGWSLIYGINLPRNTPERAAAEASYVVKKIGPALVALQIGNEPDLYSRNGIRPATFNYADYFAEWHTFATAILTTTPGAPIGGPDGARLNWLEQFVAQPMHLALASGHYYAFGPPADPGSNIDHLLRLGVKNYGQTKAVVATATKANVPYRMTEGNSCYLGGKQGVSDVFAATLWGLDYMLSMAQLGVVGINFHGGGQGFYTPIANLAAHTFAPRPLYYAMLFFREFAQQSLLSIELKPADPTLTAYASLGPNNSIHIAIINKSRTKDFTVDVPTSSPIRTLSLTAPSVESSDVTFAGAKVDANGAWSPADIKSLNPTDGLVTLPVPRASATLLRFTQPQTKVAAIKSQARIIFAGALLALASFGSHRAIAQTAPATLPANVTPAVTYSVVQGQTLVADLYTPKGEGPFPAIVFIHGGAWKGGTRWQLHGQASFMAENGFFGMAIEYRLAPRFPYPAAADDAKSAVRWLRKNAAKYNVDPDRIAVIGSSAGAHLSALLGTESTPIAKGKHRAATDASVQAVVGFNGIYDLATMPPGNLTRIFLGAECNQLPAVCKDASPQQHVKPALPPMLLLHGTADEIAPYSQAINFRDRLLEDGDSVELFTAPGAPHTFWSASKWRDPSFEAMRTFLLKVMR